MSLVTSDKSNFQFIIRLLNTNIDRQASESPAVALPRIDVRLLLTCCSQRSNVRGIPLGDTWERMMERNQPTDCPRHRCPDEDQGRWVRTKPPSLPAASPALENVMES